MVSGVETVLESAPPQIAGKKKAPFQIFPLALTAAYFLLELINILRHGMWRDEIQTWSLSLRSHSLREFLTRKLYADLGHPDGWHLLVYALSRATNKPIAMQLLHLTIATCTAYVIARFSPFTRFQKILVVFGYFLFYEYAAISRNYALGILCIFLFCAVFKPGARKNYLLLGILLALMAQSNIQALMIAMALGLAILAEGFLSTSRREFFIPNLGAITFAAVLFFASTAVAVVRMQPPPDAPFYPGLHLGLDPTSVGRTLAMMWKSFVPIPEFSRQFWNTNIVPSPPVVAFLSIFVLGFSLLFFVRKPVAFVAYAAGIGEMLLFRHVKYAGYLRHDGHAFILFLASLWLASYYPQTEIPVRWLRRIADWFEPDETRVLAGILVAQVIAAAIASSIAFRVPFSQARNTAQFLKSQHLDKMFIVGDADAPLATLAGYLERDIYYARGDRMGTYIVWDTKRVNGPKQPVIEIGKRKALEQHQDVLVILNYPAKEVGPGVRELASFTGGVVHNEEYYVYLVSYRPETQLPPA